jgi:V8-like Glu-specific endopeptidase
MGTNDLVPIYYLLEGISKARSVGRIWIRNSNNQVQGYGTGSLISPRLILTNNHVLQDINIARTALIEFNYQMNLQGQLEASEIFSLDADTFFFTDKYLDYTIVAVQQQNKKGVKPGSFGWNPLIEEEGKAIISQWVSIIQHPNGEPKKIGLRENQIIDLLPDFIHYKTDTSPGSSGSPVYNDTWEIIALHHSGVPRTNGAGDYLTADGKIWNSGMGEDKIDWIANEGIRISKILKNLKSKNLSAAQSELLNQTNLIPTSDLVSGKPVNGENISPAQVAAMGNIADGTATWIIPLSISVKLGNMGPISPPSQTNALNGFSNAASSVQVKKDQPLTEEEVLILARQEFSKRKDVLKVEWGYKFKEGWITNERCLVITVLKRKTIQELRTENNSAFPGKFDRYDLDIVEPTLTDLISYHYGTDRLERLLSPLGVVAEEIRYVNPPGLSLDKISESMRVIAHVSPERGWENLQSFLKTCRNTLTIAMYDFGAPHIVKEIKALNSGNFDALTVVMQPGSDVGSGTKKDDLEDEEAVMEFSREFGDKFKNAWVNRGKINGWISSSYHIKVAVADKKKLWLSSGNWQSSNQPDIHSPELSSKDQKFLLKNYNRDWHIIIEHSTLAKTYEDYIKYDFDNNKQTLSPDEAFLKDLNFVMNNPGIVEVDEAGVPFKAFEPFNEKRKFTVTPVLTPDNYFDLVLDLIKSARSKLYIQNQTFNAPKDSQDKLLELIDAIIDRQQAGVDVKVISRSFIASQARENLTKLREAGFDVDCIRLDTKCHTKGIMVDNTKVLIGSQNISNDGISVNRDASLLFEDEALTKYFEEIFLHDYAHAVQDIGNESMGIDIINENERITENQVRITWSEVMEML